MFKKMMIVSVLLGLFSTGLMAKEATHTKAKIPELVLTKADVVVLEKALSKGLAKLSRKEKKLIEKFLLDYSNSVKKEGIKEEKKDGDKPLPPKKKVKAKMPSRK